MVDVEEKSSLAWLLLLSLFREFIPGISLHACEKFRLLRQRAAAYTTQAKFLSRAALLGFTPTGLVSSTREAIKSPHGYG